METRAAYGGEVCKLGHGGCGEDGEPYNERVARYLIAAEEAIESVLAECDRTRRPLPTNVPSKAEWVRLAKSLTATVKKEE